MNSAECAAGERKRSAELGPGKGIENNMQVDKERRSNTSEETRQLRDANRKGCVEAEEEKSTEKQEDGEDGVSESGREKAQDGSERSDAKARAKNTRPAEEKQEQQAQKQTVEHR